MEKIADHRIIEYYYSCGVKKGAKKEDPSFLGGTKKKMSKHVDIYLIMIG